MCGFVGWINTAKERPVDRDILLAMNRSLSHRGPDDEGYFLAGNIGIAHRRLSIIDTSPLGRQPLFNEDRSVLAVVNGEIYNYQALQQELENQGHRFVSRSDSEAVVHAYEQWGLDLFNHLDGMFSLAICDLKRQRLVLAKDPFGKKPLYYTLQHGMFLFASELKAFRKNPHLSLTLNPTAVHKYLAHDYVPSPGSILAGCFKLPRASSLVLDLRNLSTLPEPTRYWQLHYEPKEAISIDEARERFSFLFQRAVSKRLRSDVPLGVFLSSGIDSSAITAMATQALTGTHTLKTFTIGFQEESFNEAGKARDIAGFFHTDHHEETLSTQAMADIFPQVMSNLDEPFADPSIIPTFLLCRFARQHITVALGGDGGDELLAGYDPFLALKVSPLFEKLPAVAIAWAKALARRLPLSHRNMAIPYVLKHFLKGFTPFARRDVELRNMCWLGAFSADALPALLQAGFDQGRWPDLYSEAIRCRQQNDAVTKVDRLIDNYINLYLHDDILVKIDRASMLNSLEVRSPFLDKELAAFVCRLPVEMKLRGLTRKFLLKESCRHKLPAAVLTGKKKGFGVPVSEWFGKKLKPLLHDTLLSKDLQQAGLFNPDYVKGLVARHLAGQEDNRKEIWNLLVFETWRRAHNI